MQLVFFTSSDTFEQVENVYANQKKLFEAYYLNILFRPFSNTEKMLRVSERCNCFPAWLVNTFSKTPFSSFCFLLETVVFFVGSGTDSTFLLSSS